MKEEHKKLDTLIYKVVKEQGIESPSNDFLNNVMSNIESSKIGEFQYTPLISKRVWVIIGLSLAVIFGYLYFSDISVPFLENIEVLEGFKHKIGSLNLEALNFSTTTLYSMTAAFVMILFQIPVIKYVFDRQWRQRAI